MLTFETPRTACVKPSVSRGAIEVTGGFDSEQRPT